MEPKEYAYKAFRKDNGRPYRKMKGKVLFSEIGHIKNSMGQRGIDPKNYNVACYELVLREVKDLA